MVLDLVIKLYNHNSTSEKKLSDYMYIADISYQGHKPLVFCFLHFYTQRRFRSCHVLIPLKICLMIFYFFFIIIIVYIYICVCVLLWVVNSLRVSVYNILLLFSCTCFLPNHYYERLSWYIPPTHTQVRELARNPVIITLSALILFALFYAL